MRAKGTIRVCQGEVVTPASLGYPLTVCKKTGFSSASDMLVCTAFCVWSVIQSESPISISLVFFQQKLGERDLENEIFDWDLRLEKSHSKCNRLYLREMPSFCFNPHSRIWQEAYIHEKRPIQMKRDLYIHEKRPIQINPHGNIWQGAYLHEKRPIPMKRDHASANDTYKFDLQKRPMYSLFRGNL